MDIVGPLASCRGFMHLFTLIDCTTRWPEAIPLSKTTTEDCTHALIDGWIARLGAPLHITSDRGAQFTSSLWAALVKALGSTHASTTAYHPPSNGLVERFHRTLKTSLCARVTGPY